MNREKLPFIDEDAVAHEHPRIFHYTAVGNLENILTSGGLFATHYGKTNDRAEFKALRQPLAAMMYRRALPLVRERVARGELDFRGDEEKLKEVLRRDTERSFDILVRTAPTPPHITCFSAHVLPHEIQNGLLTMWRLYGGDGGGVALGFNTAKLIEIKDQLQDKIGLATAYLDKVGYGTDPQTLRRLRYAPAVTRIYERAFNLQFSGGSELVGEQGEDLMRFFVLCASSKHPDFVDEREIRLVVAKSMASGLNGRAKVPSLKAGTLLIQYLDALEEVIVGPSDQQAKLLRSVRASLRSAGLSHVALRKSATPYRHAPKAKPQTSDPTPPTRAR